MYDDVMLTRGWKRKYCQMAGEFERDIDDVCEDLH